MVDTLTEQQLVELGCLFEFAGREVTPGDAASTERLMAYWAEGKGAAKIGWGTAGDFYRCETELGKYVGPTVVKGLCANLHKRATGASPGHAPGEAAMTSPATLVERAPITTAPDAKTGRGLIQVITPGWGSSGYYSREVLAEAANRRVFGKGTKMYADHPTPTEEAERPGRSIKDIVAVLTEDARIGGDGGLVAGIEVLPQFRESLAALAKHDAIGCSIRADGTTLEEGEAEGRTGRIITEISEGHSVDFVTAAGRGGKVLMLESRSFDLVGLGEALHRATTTDVPAPAGESTTNNTLEITMGQIQIEEAEVTRLREAAGRVTTLETKLAESEQREATALRLLAETRAGITAGKRARDKVRKDNATLASATVDRIVEAATRTVPLIKDGERAGQLDEAAFDVRVDEARKAEETYLASLREEAGAGNVTGMGGAGGAADFTEADLDREIAKTFNRKPLEEAKV